MKLTPEMLQAGTHRGRFQLWYYDHKGLYEPVRKLADSLVGDYGWECWSDEKHVGSYALDVIENCITAGLLEVPSGPTDTAPSQEEQWRQICETHGIPYEPTPNYIAKENDENNND